MAVEIFTDGSNRELLLVELREPGTTDPEVIREQTQTQARKRVDGDHRWQGMTLLAERKVADGEAHFARIERFKEDYKKDRFTEWHQQETETWAADLRKANAEFKKMADGILQTFPGSVLNSPVTTVDAINLSTQTRLFSEASPDQAGKMVLDAVQRGDTAFLTAARFLLESWQGHRNAWSSADGRLKALELLEVIAEASPDVARFAGEYAAERVEGFRIAWRYLLNQLLSGDGQLDPVHRQVGAFGELLEPVG